MSDSTKYSISDLAHYSGVKAPTIRMWEKRYNLFCPKRSFTNIRTYSDEELRKLINVHSLIQAGWKISKVVLLQDEQLDLEVKETMLAKDQKVCPDYLINSMIVHMLAFDEPKFASVIDHIIEQFGIKQTIKNSIYPFIKRVGLLWQVNDISPAQEHFASAIIRRKLLSAIDHMEFKPKGEATFVLCLPHDEFHELPLILAHYILLENNIRTIYLGGSVPSSVAAGASLKIKASHLFTVFMSSSPMEKLKDYLLEIQTLAPSLKISFSGCPQICKKPLVNDTIVHLNTIEDFEQMIQSIVKAQS